MKHFPMHQRVKGGRRGAVGKQRERQEGYLRLVDQYSDMVQRLALHYLGNLADAQDVCQEVYIKLFKHQRPFNDAEHEKAWIIRVTINTCKDVIRSPWRKWFSPIKEALLPIKDTQSREVVAFVLTLPGNTGWSFISTIMKATRQLKLQRF